MNEVAVRVRDLRVRRGKKLVFDGINLEVPRGQITGMLGPSGCGKTTLMRSIVGVQKLAGGSVEVLGEVAGARALRRRVAYDTQASKRLRPARIPRDSGRQIMQNTSRDAWIA